MEINVFANNGIVADALAVLRAPVPASSWECSHASTQAMTAGGVRLRRTAGDPSYLPLRGFLTSSPPV